jgi:hypothetical protein
MQPIKFRMGIRFAWNAMANVGKLWCPCFEWALMHQVWKVCMNVAHGIHQNMWYSSNTPTTVFGNTKQSTCWSIATQQQESCLLSYETPSLHFEHQHQQTCLTRPAKATTCQEQEGAVSNTLEGRSQARYNVPGVLNTCRHARSSHSQITHSWSVGQTRATAYCWTWTTK